MSATATKRTAETKRRTFDLAKKSARDAFLKMLDEEDGETDVTDFSDIGEYIRDGIEPALRVGDTLLFDEPDSMNVVGLRGGVLYLIDEYGPFGDFLSTVRNMAEHANANTVFEYAKNPIKSCNSIGFIVDKPIGKYKKTLVPNGDEGFNQMVGFNTSVFPTISVSCLSQMFFDSADEDTKVSIKFSKGELEIVDFIPDEEIELTAAQKKQWSAYKREQQKVKPDPTVQMPKAKPGFTLVDGLFHRASTVLFYDKSDKTSYIFGQDEGTYFGCKLADNPKTVGDAFTSLIPEAARQIVQTPRRMVCGCY